MNGYGCKNDRSVKGIRQMRAVSYSSNIVVTKLDTNWRG